MTDSTLLVLEGPGLPPYASRALTQTLEHIPAAAQLMRTINGELDDVSAEQFRKYRTTITCSDQQAPALGGVWPGMELTVQCMAELAQKSESTELPTESDLGREAVPGSIREESGFIFYRPILVMRVIGFNQTHDEWGATIGWSLDLEEV